MNIRPIGLLLAGSMLSSAPALARPAEVPPSPAAANIAVPSDDQRPMQTAAPVDDDDSVIVVTGERPRTEATSGTKSNTPIADTPQSISVVDSEEIARLGLQNLSQVLRFVPGVTTELRGSSAEVYDLTTLRGLTAFEYLDGLRLFSSPSGYAAPQIDVSRLSRLEVLKGPASALYGASGPGGLYALSSKLPLDQESYGAVSATAGSYDLYRFDADVGGKIGDNVGYRLYGSVNGAHTQQTWGKRERQTVSGAVTFGLNSPTSLTLLGNYSHDPYNGTYSGFPLDGTLQTNPNGQVSTHFDAGEKDNRFKRNQAAGTYILNHDFGGGWHFRSSGRYQYVESDVNLVYSSGSLDATETMLNRGSYVTNEHMRAWTFDNQLTGTVRTGPIEHRLMLGLDSQVLHSYEIAAFGSATSINLYNPVYGTMPVPRSVYEVPGYTPTFGYDPTTFATPATYEYENRQRGVYAQDEMAWGGLRVTLSGRQDWARVHSLGTDAVDSDKFTYRAGALYKLPFGLAPYISYATSFEPQAGLVLRSDGTTGQADPSEGKQLEVGAKYQVPGSQILITGAWFRINQTNLLQALPNTNYSIQTGVAKSRGFELEANAPLPYGFLAKVAVTRQSVRDTDGSRLVMAGRGGVAGNLEWAPRDGAFNGFAVGGSIRYVDHVSTGVDGVSTPRYTLFDALARLDLGKLFPQANGLTAAVNVANLFDKKYVTGCYSAYQWCWYGNRRTVQGTIGFRW
ncbi:MULTISPECIES: TonB-dependent siderophore receptor [unclassified Sphingomonas]|uniref:TonB-dependent siderophore receptor n=1 Tax=unclassified Sphingomonas TaxID=196159 RepID=UPI00226B6FB9|nr:MULTISPECIES: TonB-dependent siderophore receptor [unclassified Sphingomonas]